jgi:hypothetical protein
MPLLSGLPVRVALRWERNHLPTELASGRTTLALCQSAGSRSLAALRALNSAPA